MLNKLKIIFKLPWEVWLMLISHLPGEAGFLLRYKYWKRRLKFLGKRVRIDTGVFFQNPDYISIDDNCWIDKNVIILAGLDNSEREKIRIPNKHFKGEPGVVYIGKNIHIGPGCILSGISAGIYISNNCGFSANCKVFAFSHHYRSKKNPEKMNVHFGPLVSHDMQCVMEGPVYIGFNTGFALNSVVLPGVAIPENCFISISSVVYPGRYANNSVLSGDPAKKIGDRFVKNNKINTFLNHG